MDVKLLVQMCIALSSLERRRAALGERLTVLEALMDADLLFGGPAHSDFAWFPRPSDALVVSFQETTCRRPIAGC